MGRDYLVVAGRIARDALDRALTTGYEVRDYRTHATEAVALVVKTDRAMTPLKEQADRIRGFGQVCVHMNPRLPDIRTVVLGTLTYDPPYAPISPLR